jgi:hypothetical protein
MIDFAFTEKMSACPNPTVSVHARIDPYWAELWASGASASWVSQAVARQQSDAGIGHIPARLNIPEDHAWSRLLRRAAIARTLNVMGVLDSWRTVTGEQLAAITGETTVAGGQSTSMPELYAAGLIDNGIFINGLMHTRNTERGTLYRPSRNANFDQKLAPRLTYPEWVSVTGGHPFESGGQFDRHNVLATELALRVAEWCEIGAVVGEKLSTFELLAHSGLGLPGAVGARRAADATLIRTDGARIAVEMTASTGPHFEAKVQRWATLISNRRMDVSGLAVVFVVASRSNKAIRKGEYLTAVRKQIAAAARDSPGMSFDRTASRMFVVDWRDWFPTPGRVAQSFFALEASRPTGPNDAVWEQASILDPFDVPFTSKEPEGALAILDNLAMIRSVPHWLRTGRAPELWPSSVKRIGFNRIPIADPVRPSDFVGIQLGAASGVAGQTKPPRRLRARPEL